MLKNYIKLWWFIFEKHIEQKQYCSIRKKSLSFSNKTSHTPGAPETSLPESLMEQKLDSIFDIRSLEKILSSLVFCSLCYGNSFLCLSDTQLKYNRYIFFPFIMGPSALPSGKCDLLVTNHRYCSKHKNKKNKHWYVSKTHFPFITYCHDSFIQRILSMC